MYSSSTFNSYSSGGYFDRYARFGNARNGSNSHLGSNYELPGRYRPSSTRFSSYSSLYYRPRFTDNSPRPSHDDTFFRYRRYAPKDAVIPNEAKAVLNVDLCREENQKSHHTDGYLANIAKLVVRRGQPFTLKVCIAGTKFSNDTDRIQMLFSAGSTPMESKGTLANVHVCNSQKDCVDVPEGRWSGFITETSENTINVQVTSPSDAIVGSYKLTVKLFLGSGRAGDDDKEEKQEKLFLKELEDEVYVLFNPWVKEDQTYLDDDAKRQEYVLNDTGRVYVGSSDYISGKPWVFGQFEKSCFEAAFYLLDKSYLGKRSHGNATQVTRALSAMTNSSDYDKGVLTGNWSGNYSGGTSPTAWNGSVAILEEYITTKRSVKYGQCWVFSALLTTLCRTLGIPTRSVTNFDSAHDTDFSMTIDKHYNTELESMDELDRDSVWNFHVWNEAWFTRSDLPEGYDGWQAFDATPQEESEGQMRCGPSPLTAIKNGNVFIGYDTRFIFAEANADRVVWLVDANGDMKPMKQYSDTNSVGNNISTKAVASNEREDITNLYKYPEGSQEERDAVERASRFSSRISKLAAFYDDDVPDDVTFHCEAACVAGGDIEMTFKAKNEHATEKRSVQVKIRTTAVYYTGVVGEQITQDEQVLEIEPGTEATVPWRLEAADYLNRINEDAKLKLYVTAKVKDTKQFFFKDQNFELDKPDLVLTADKSSVAVNQTVTVTVKFQNPVNVDLTEGILRLEGPGIQRNLKIPLHRRIPIGGELVEKVPLTPRFAGQRELVACFNCRQLTGITGALTLNVTD